MQENVKEETILKLPPRLLREVELEENLGLPHNQGMKTPCLFIRRLCGTAAFRAPLIRARVEGSHVEEETKKKCSSSQRAETGFIT